MTPISTFHERMEGVSESALPDLDLSTLEDARRNARLGAASAEEKLTESLSQHFSAILRDFAAFAPSNEAIQGLLTRGRALDAAIGEIDSSLAMEEEDLVDALEQFTRDERRLKESLELHSAATEVASVSAMMDGSLEVEKLGEASKRIDSAMSLLSRLPEDHPELKNGRGVALAVRDRLLGAAEAAASAEDDGTLQAILEMLPRCVSSVE